MASALIGLPIAGCRDRLGAGVSSSAVREYGPRPKENSGPPSASVGSGRVTDSTTYGVDEMAVRSRPAGGPDVSFVVSALEEDDYPWGRCGASTNSTAPVGTRGSSSTAGSTTRLSTKHRRVASRLLIAARPTPTRPIERLRLRVPQRYRPSTRSRAAATTSGSVIVASP